jgi:hypothetical protein
MSQIVGRILRASTRGFDCGTHSNGIGEMHNFGSFVKAPITNSDGVYAIGLIYQLEIKDDQLVTELVMGEHVPFNVLQDQRQNRMIPVEIKVLNIGSMDATGSWHSLPPRPPMSLSDVVPCTDSEIRTFTSTFDYFRLILGASEVPADDLIAAAVRGAADVRSDVEYRPFLVACGQQIARELSGDLKRLSHVLSLIRP